MKIMLIIKIREMTDLFQNRDSIRNFTVSEIDSILIVVLSWYFIHLH
jgi:hypothetical protein